MYNRLVYQATRIVLFIGLWSVSLATKKVIYAVNAGGEQHTDSHGIKYLADTLNVGVGSNYGTRFNIRRVPVHDQILYQTERWHDGDFGYNVDVKQDGQYVLVMKFSEVYFSSSNDKVFDIQLNKRHVVAKNLDIFDTVGHGTAHDVVVPFKIEGGKLSVVNEFSTFNDVLTIEFKKGLRDNPKICAFYIIEGTVDDVPQLPSLKEFDPSSVGDEEVEEDEEEDTVEKTSKKETKKRLKSGPPANNPYAEDSSSLVMPIMVAFGCFIPALLCLCRL